MWRTVKWWLPTAAMTLLSLLSYVDRGVLALLSPTILGETGLSAQQYGWIISAFSVAYLVGNPVWGRLLDRYGVRAGLTVAVLLWTSASVSHAFARGAVTFALARAALGFGEGATFPGGLRTATQTLRPGERARGLALAYSGGSLGAVITPLLVMPIAARWGWRGAFLATGLLGLTWLVIWSAVSRDPRLPAQAPARTPPALGDRTVWAFMAAYAFGGIPLGFVLYGAPIHLARGLGCDQATIGRVLWIPPLGWEVGYFFWGYWIDRNGRRGDRPDPARFDRHFALLSLLSLTLAATPLTHSLFAALALLAFGMFVASGFVIASLAETTRRHGSEHGGYLAGLGAGAWSGVMALVMPLFGRLFDHGQFGAAYLIAATLPALGWLVWRGLTR